MAGTDYPRNWREFDTQFDSEQACMDYLERVRWPDGFRCRACGSDSFWRTIRSQLMCRDCGRQTTVIAGAKARGLVFYRLVEQVVSTPPQPYHAITGGRRV